MSGNTDGDGAGLGLTEGVGVTLGVGVAEGVGLTLGDGLGLLDGVGVGQVLGVGVGVWSLPSVKITGLLLGHGDGVGVPQPLLFPWLPLSP